MCMYCKSYDLTESITIHVVNCNGCLIIIKNVPCEECEQCGAKYYSDETARQLRGTSVSLFLYIHIKNERK